MALWAELFAAAFLASIFGSMVGLGGGFILVPVLLLWFGLPPAQAAGTSLVLVVANSASGAFTYLMQGRVHVRLGLLLAAGGLPGSIAGGVLVLHVSGKAFDLLFGLFLLAVSCDMIWNHAKRGEREDHARNVNALKGMSYRLTLLIGLVVGFFSSLFGIGGGVAVVPALLYFSELPAHAISATSHFAIFLTSPIGLATHGLEHTVRKSYVVPLIAGGLCGGPLGARLSIKLRSPVLMLFVGSALAIAALVLIARNFFLR